jgi:hypothetical protein
MKQLVPRAPRRDIVSPVELTFDDVSGTRRGVLVNVSTTGMLVHVDEGKASGTPLTFGFSSYQGRGEIVWSAEAGEGGALLGMKFVSIERLRAEDALPARDAAGISASVSGRAAARSAVEGSRPSFAETTGILVRNGITLGDVAHALGQAASAVRRARLDPSAPDYLPPPHDWRSRLAPLARGRGTVLDRIARQLEEVDGF